MAMAIDLVSGSRHRTGRICQSFVTESTCLLRLGGEQVPQLRFQQGKGLAAVAMGFFLRQRHLSEGEAGAAHFKNRVVAKAAVAAGGCGDPAITMPFHFDQHAAIRGNNTKCGTELSVTFAGVAQRFEQFFDPFRV